MRPVVCRLDGLTASDIRTKYPQYNNFAYKPFYSGLNNVRKKHNKEVQARGEHTAKGGECKFDVFIVVVIIVLMLILMLITNTT